MLTDVTRLFAREKISQAAVAEPAAAAIAAAMLCLAEAIDTRGPTYFADPPNG